MTKKEQKPVIFVSVVLLVFLALFYERLYEQLPVGVFRAAFCIFTNVFEISAVLLWCVSVKNRIINKQICRYLIYVGSLMCFWLVIRMIKWFFVSHFDTVGRYLWYFYYVPMIFIPLFGVFITLFIGKTEDYSLPRLYRLLYIPAFLLITLIVTNDLHRFTFDFPNGIYYYNNDYTYNFVFYIACGWFIILGAVFVVTMIIKCRVPGTKAFQKMPAIVLAVATVFWIIYYLGFRGCDLVAMDCLMIIMLLESSIRSGLIRSNQGYNEIFEKTNIGVRIVDKDYTQCYSSCNARAYSNKVMMKAVQNPVDIGNIRICGKPISGGYVFWQEDISQIKKLMYELRETQEILNENNDLLRAENELIEKKSRIDEKNRLYDRIARDVSVQLEKAEKLILTAEKNPEKANDIFPILCVLSAYIKRRGNLLLLSEDYYFINSKELGFCLRESLDNISINNVYVALTGNCDCNIPVEYAVLIYDLFEMTTELLLEDMTAFLVNFCCKENRIVLRLQIGCNKNVDINMLKAVLTSPFVRDISAEDEDVTVLIESERTVTANG